MPIRTSEASLHAEGEDWTTVRSARARLGDHDREHLILAAPAVDLASTVITRQGDPIEDATVTVQLAPSALAELEVPLDLTSVAVHATTSHEGGGLRLERAPHLADARLVAWKRGFERDARPVPDTDRDDLEIVLARSAIESGTRPVLEGRVIDPGGAPVPNARIVLGEHSATVRRRRTVRALPSGPDCAAASSTARSSSPGLTSFWRGIRIGFGQHGQDRVAWNVAVVEEVAAVTRPLGSFQHARGRFVAAARYPTPPFPE